MGRNFRIPPGLLEVFAHSLLVFGLDLRSELLADFQINLLPGLRTGGGTIGQMAKGIEVLTVIFLHGGFCHKSRWRAGFGQQ